MQRTTSNQKTRLQAAAAAVVALCLLATACTKKVDDTDTTIYTYVKANIKGLDPIKANDLYSNTAVSQIYEGLLEYHYLKRPFTLQPALADGMPVASADGLTHTFKIKKGVKFHDNPCFANGKGRDVTAKDFVYSFRRIADPKNVSDGFWIFDGKIVGLNEWAEATKTGKADYNTPIEGLQTPDDNTLVIKLKAPYYQLYYVLAMGFASVVPREAVEKYGAEIINNPVGTGPFMLAKASDWIRNSKLTLLRNPNYRQELYPSEGEPEDAARGLLADAGKPVPFAEKLVIQEITEDQPRWQNFMKGNLDYIEVPNDNFDSVIAKDNRKDINDEIKSKGMRLGITPYADTTYNGFNTKDPILGKSKELRQAISLTQDTATMIAKFYNGRAVAAQGPIPPGFGSYDADFKNPYVQFNLEKAKALLAKAGYPEGKGLPEIQYDIPSDSKQRQLAEFFAQGAAAIGVKIKINPSTWPQFSDKIKKSQTQIFGIAWSADYPDAQNFFQLFYSKNASPGPNDTSFTNAEFDKLYEKALLMPPSPERDAVYKQMRDVVVEEAPWMFGIHRLRYELVQGWLSNYKYNDMSFDGYKYIKVDPKKRAELKAKL